MADWNQVVKKVTPHVVRIDTPVGHGTGFIYMYNENRDICGIATALHVVTHADQWRQPIRIFQPSSERVAFLNAGERVVFPEWNKESAAVVIPYRDLEFPEEPIPLFPTETPLGIGVEVGWLGFPAIEANTLCLFSGSVSARQDHRNAYLIDGVAINGVSGGPVVYSDGVDDVRIVGTVSAYQANRATGEALPGLLIAQDVSHFHAVLKHVKSIDEAQRKQAELQKLQPQTPPSTQPDLMRF